MDPITLATAATSLLAPFIKKAGAAALDKIAEQLPDTVGKVWSALSKKSSITEAASDLAQNPDDAFNEETFKRQLQKEFAKDQEFASLLTDLVEEAKSEAGISNVNTVEATDGGFAIGRDNQINNNAGSTISVGNVQQGGRKRK